jgi:hypothetical protein
MYSNPSSTIAKKKKRKEGKEGGRGQRRGTEGEREAPRQMKCLYKQNQAEFKKP